MKVLSYNISWFKQEKVDWALSHENVDAFVLPECANKDKTNIPEEYIFYWTGDYDNKGLGVIVSNKRKHIIPSCYKENLSYAIPVLFDDEYLLLAVWPTIIKGKTSNSYIDLLLDILEYYQPYIDKYKTVIIGDYNIISTPSKPQGKKQHSTDIFDWMKQHNLLSAHHTMLKEEYGNESSPSYYHMYRENSKFFIDYAFTNAEIIDYKLFSWNETNRMSDHVPVVLEVN